jgi:hypothetical protein
MPLLVLHNLGCSLVFVEDANPYSEGPIPIIIEGISIACPDKQSVLIESLIHGHLRAQDVLFQQMLRGDFSDGQSAGFARLGLGQSLLAPAGAARVNRYPLTFGFEWRE